jgi:hypothetical protein
MTMTDIVKRLRNHASSFRGTEMYREAADEIERLRKAVRAERAAILELIESERAEAHLYNADSALRAVATAIKAREQQP